MAVRCRLLGHIRPLFDAGLTWHGDGPARFLAVDFRCGRRGERVLRVVTERGTVVEHRHTG